MATKYLTLAAGGLAYAVSYEEPDGLPTAPTEYPVPAYAPPVGGTTYTPANGTELQTALTNCHPGDVIVLDKDTTYTTGSNASFTLSAKTPSSAWIYIVSSDVASLPAGTRATPSDVDHMPTLTAYSYLAPTIVINEGVSKVRFVGLEITTNQTATDQIQYGLIRVGWWGGTNAGGYYATLADAATDIVFDRCYIHGTAGHIRDGIVFYNSAGFALIDSTVADFKGVGVEAHGLHIAYAAGPTLVHNNFIESGGINLFIADSYLARYDGPAGDLMKPCDITVTNNHFFKPTTWNPLSGDWDGITRLVKNHFEIKGGSRILCSGNVMQNCWGNQFGSAVVVKSNGCDADDIEIRNNFIMDCGITFTLSAQPEGGVTGAAALQVNRVVFENNLAIRGTMTSAVGNIQTSANTGDGCYFHDVHIDHNTIVFDYTEGAFNYIAGTNAMGSDCSMSNNIAGFQRYGLYNSGVGVGFTGYQGFSPDMPMQNNVLVLNGAGTQGSSYNTSGVFGPFYFPNEFTDVGFVDAAGTEVADYGLTVGSTYHNAATDGTDIGINATTLAAAIAGVV